MPKALLYIGVMSGSSLDGIDVALTDFAKSNGEVIATHFQAYSNEIKSTLLELHFPSENELVKSALAANQLACLYAEAINTLLAKNNLTPNQIVAIGCHGQTIRHQPRYQNDIGYTIQLGNNALLAELTKIAVVGDFRSRDIAAGGQGAPLVPAFHQAVFASKNQSRAIVNIGGIANITYLGKSGDVIGFDCGPGNILLDHWIKRTLGKSYDADGKWASTGAVEKRLLESMLADPYFALTPPKSTGRDLFNETWLNKHLTSTHYSPENIARTLTALTAETISQAIHRYCPDVNEVYLCGGGAHNNLLRDNLTDLLPQTSLSTTSELGVNVDWVEATAFAWLAKQTIENSTSNLPAVTGAAGLRVLGAIYPA